MKFYAKNEEEAKKMMAKFDQITKILMKKANIKEEDIPNLEEFLNEELLELHYCRKGTRMCLSTKDPDTIMIMMADIIGHLLSEVPEDKRNDVLVMAISTSNLDDMTGPGDKRRK